MKYVKIYDRNMMPCGVIDLNGDFPSEASNKFVKAYDNNNKLVGVLELGTELTEAQRSLSIHVYDENMSPCGNMPAHITEKNVQNPNIELTPSSFTYSGSPCVPTVVVKDGDTVVPASEYTVEITNNVNAGTATVTITDKVGGDYNVAGTTTFQIAKANPTYTAPTGKTGLEYTGEAQALLNAGSTEHGTIKYSLDGENWYTDIPTGTAAQIYTVYWKLDGDTNHSDVVSTSISVEIAAAQVESVTPPTISGNTPFTDSTQVTISANDDAEIRYTTDNTTPTSESTLYSAPFTLSATTTVKAIAIKGGVSSEVATKMFIIEEGGM